MTSFIELASANLLSPMVLFFVLGVVAALLRSSLSVPEAVAKALSIYLIMAIGLKGGHEVALAGISASLVYALLAGVILSFLLPLLAYGALRATTKLPAVDRASIAAHYGSISIVTFLAAVEVIRGLGYGAEGYMVAVAAVMEVPAILSGLWLAARSSGHSDATAGAVGVDRTLLREVMLNGSIVLLVGAFLIGAVIGDKGMSAVAPLIVDPFKGVLCIFLLDMGLVAGRGLRDGWRKITPAVLLFGLYMPLLGAGAGWLSGFALGLQTGGVALLMVLCASASYIAVPAAMRLALPDANPSISLTLALGLTFPFNLTIGIPIYIAAASLI
ncbi:sodium-dependent bicarbonate transport family permease [Thalassospira sp.]|uniref:sodium-dependent bicarbonate transport family permease n=1 Tax=Thalassospira sp. TaxID=1912094 RepID=UPI0027330C61|nr:sodium-dependent bicarbonate transport family permease [Thalassospira sp.]MDP2697143.1 sodium-dependent bicarbonate transport family permease [Thalassospira sp.]